MSVAIPYLPPVSSTSLQATAEFNEKGDLNGTLPPHGPLGIISFFAVDKVDLTGFIDFALVNGKYREGIFLLSSMRMLGHKVDMSVRWRWIREYRVDSGFSRRDCELTAKETDMLALLVALLRLAGPTDPSLPALCTQPSIVEGKTWDLRSTTGTSMSQDAYGPCASEHASLDWTEWIKSQFRIIRDIPGHELEQPNISQRDITPPQTMRSIPNMHYLKDMLSREECGEIISAADTIGFLPDIPTGPVPEKGTTRGLYFYWVVDDAFYAKLWSRVEAFIPKTFNGKKLRGVSRWSRLYRYILEQQYAAHIDGSWTPSGIDPVTDTYAEDASHQDGKQLSLLTFLVYLNEDFTGAGGETTFFLPSANADGQMNAYSVQPGRGSVLLFPHGEIEQAIYHQGSPVSDHSGNTRPKYVIRSEVMYNA